MQSLIERHSVGLFFGILLMVIAGYIDMRTIAGSMNDNLVKVVDLAEMTRAEQLLRTDEIEWVQETRKKYPGSWGHGADDHIVR